jgi:hypothetical protein
MGKSGCEKKCPLVTKHTLLAFCRLVCLFCVPMCVDVDSAIFAKNSQTSKVKIMYFKQKETAIVQKLPPYYAVLRSTITQWECVAGRRA